MCERQTVPNTCNYAARSRGFTLVELMIVVAIIAILGAIAYPSYQQQMRETRRSDAYAALSRLADLQERYYLQNRTYTTDMGALGAQADSPEDYYDLSVTAADANTYTLQATADPAESQASDAGCTSLTLNQAGQKLPALCW